jgi:hypothetical protein
MNTDFTNDEKYKRRMKFKAEMKKFWNQYPWEWFVSLNFKRSVSSAAFAEKVLKNWRIELQREESIQIACDGVLSLSSNPHLHLVLFGRSRTGRTLLSLNPKKWERKWLGDAKIKEVYSSGAVGYMVDQNMSEGWYESIMPYGMKHLKKHKLPT